jgi:hypothetical protein
MASRDVWSRAGSMQVRDLLSALLSTRLLMDSETNYDARNPLYVCSPYLTDFPLFDNAFGQFQPLFRSCPEYGEQSSVLFSQVLIEISSRMPVRIVGVPGDYADAFMKATVRVNFPNISGRYASELYHEKGLLCSAFYLEGSMNFTYSGIYRRDEKITAHTSETPSGQQKIYAATKEFDRLWHKIAALEIVRTP